MQTKTLVEIAAFPPPMGAWSQRIEFVADAWRARGHACVLMNIGASRKLRDARYLNVRNPLDYLWQVYRAARKGCVLHTHTNAKGVKGNLLALIAQVISRVVGSRCALTFHAGLQQEYFPKGTYPVKDRLLTLVFRTADVIICNSPAVKKQIVQDYGVPDKRVHPIQAFSAEYMETHLGSLPDQVQQFAENHDPLLVSYVFFFHPEFTVDTMIAAVQRLREKYPTLGLIIMGSTQDAENYTSLIEEFKLDRDILITGNLPRSQFLAVLQRASLYLRTPLGDGVASSVLEALSLRTPVVASDNGTRPAGCVLYRNNDLSDMVAKIDHTLSHHEELAAAIVLPELEDTVTREVELLMSLVEC